MGKDSTKQSERYTYFLNELEKLGKVEEKVRHCLDFMNFSLSQEKKPAYRDFWSAKQLCLTLFKEKITTRSRAVFWSEYLQLSKEMQNLKEILSEESNFAQEQIGLAIEAVEKELMDGEYVLKKDLSPEKSKTLQKNGKLYCELQAELDRFQSFATKIQSLRKEVLATQMRIRSKNQFLDRLSKLGDQVFPKRKEMIEGLSEMFSQDIDQFVSDHFSLDQPPYFALKEEIKKLQGFAKEISINTNTFTQMRTRLSGCWEKIREKEQLHRKAQSEKNEQFQANFEKIATLIEPLKQSCISEALSLEEAHKKEEEILSQMKELELRSGEVHALKKRLKEAKRPLEVKEQEKRQQRKEAEEKSLKEEEEKKSQLFEKLHQEMETLESDSEEVLEKKMTSLKAQTEALSFSKIQQALIDHQLALFSDAIAELKWKKWASEMPQDFVEISRSLLEERGLQRQKLKAALEKHRKAYGASGLALEESLGYTDLIDQEKERLTRLESLIEEIEIKLWNLEE